MSASLRWRALIVQIAVLLHFAGILAAALAAQWLVPGGIAADWWGRAGLALGASFWPQLFTGPLLATVFLVWLWRAYANLRGQGLSGLARSPGGAVGVWFIPIVNLVAPFATMRELWNRSAGEDEYQSLTPVALVSSWWACWIGGGLLVTIVFGTVLASFVRNVVVSTSESLLTLMLIMSQLMWYGAVVQLALLVHRITAMQQAERYSAAVFN